MKKGNELKQNPKNGKSIHSCQNINGEVTGNWRGNRFKSHMYKN